MTSPEIIVTSIISLFFVLLLVIAGFRMRLKDAAVVHLALYIALGLLASLAYFTTALRISPLPGIPNMPFTQLMPLTTVLAFGALSLHFLKKKRSNLIGYWVGALLLVFIWNILTFNLWNWGSFAVIPGVSSPFIVAGVGWIAAIATILGVLTTEFRKRQSAKYLNRLRYWLIATTLLSAGGLILFVNPAIFYWSGLPLMLVGSMVASYIVLSYHTPDLNLLIGRSVHYAGVTITVTVILYLGLAATVIVSRSSLNPGNVFFWSVILAVLLAIVVPLLWRHANRLLNRIIFGKKERDEKQVIQHYSQSVSGALDMQRLGKIVINLMIETLGIEQGIVFVNDRSGSTGVALRPLASVGINDNLTTGQFNADSLFTNYFRSGQKYLHQYDIDVLPKFGSMHPEERVWLSKLGMELHVPILRHRDVVGMLSFGPRSSGTAYYEEDIDLMIALAEQSSLALDSAQLFEQLATVNREVGLLSEKLEGLDQSKNDFLSIASHELRTPLTHILGYSRMLLDLTEEELKDPDYVKKMTEGIAKGSERMKDVIDVMFDVTEAHIGEMNLFSGPVALEEVVDQATRPFLIALDERRIAFAKNGFEELPIVEADGTRLVQAFENFISNAIKYTPDGGMVTIDAHTTALENGEQAIEITVADTGIGIDPQHHERIFDKVFRVDDADHHSTGKTKFKGAGPGLGLALVKAIAEAHGGKVWVESPGRDEVNYPGSRFFFVIPLKQSSAVTPPQSVKRQSQIETVHWRSKDLKPSKE